MIRRLISAGGEDRGGVLFKLSVRLNLHELACCLLASRVRPSAFRPGHLEVDWSGQQLCQLLGLAVEATDLHSSVQCEHPQHMQLSELLNQQQNVLVDWLSQSCRDAKAQKELARWPLWRNSFVRGPAAGIFQAANACVN
ncbi:unnamed protein product, partial [Protopolystoma xenopodis]